MRGQTRMIRFACTCGRSLRAPEKLAGKSARCPACNGSVVVPQPIPVPLPALSASASLSLAPADITFQEWPASAEAQREDDPNVYALAAVPPTAWVPNLMPGVDPNYVPPAPYKRHPFEVWIDPLAGMKFVIQISGMLAVLTALGVALYPHVLQQGLAWINGLCLAFVWASATALFISYGCRFLDSMLEYALAGSARNVHVPDYDPGPAMTSLARWAVCFGYGPAFLFYIAFHHWIHCGDMTRVDALILAELTVPAVIWWMTEQLVLATRPDLAHVSPARVLSTIRGLGWRALFLGLAATAAGFIHICLGAAAIMLLHQEWLAGILLLWLVWFSAWQSSALALRKLGNWQHQRSAAAGVP